MVKVKGPVLYFLPFTYLEDEIREWLMIVVKKDIQLKKKIDT